jgi:hypothetical protein
MGVIKYPESYRTAHSYSLLPPAARNLFEKRFLDLQKLFIMGKKNVDIFFLSCYTGLPTSRRIKK